MSKSGLGKAIQNRINKKHQAHMGKKAPIFYQESETNEAEVKKQKMKSVIEQNSLSQFLQLAELSQQNFKADRDIKFKEVREQVRQKKIIVIGEVPILVEEQIDQKPLKGLQMPRRPNWKQFHSKKQLEQKQADAYINWRRNLAVLEESSPEIRITPYEKNVEVWRQLWRVTERADLMIQIVDGRDPLFFHSEDLTAYVKQIGSDKKSLLLINKSDLVDQQTRKRWNKYFIQNNISHLFFSAKLATVTENDNESEMTKQTEILTSEDKLMEKYYNKPQILTVDQLKSFLNHFTTVLEKQNIEVGLVGYPNVGKSSVINALFGKKKVGVASMPGKTKHFQTLKLTNNVTLCDCPGLVFPRISASHAYMMLNGLYPIDNMKSFTQPLKILVERVPQKMIEQVYSLFWKQNQIYDGETLLNKYSQLKGFFTGNGLPNQSHAAKTILKDYVNGELAYARNPPGLQGHEQLVEQNLVSQIKEQKYSSELTKMYKREKNLQNEIDEQFFKATIAQKQTEEDLIRQLTEDDLLDIIQGKKLSGMKITKEMRKNIKHAMKRGQTIEQIKKKFFSVQVKQSAVHKHMIKNE